MKSPTRLVVRLDSTGAVVELQLARHLTTLQQAFARAVGPTTPCPAMVRPGPFAFGEFARSEAGYFRNSEASVDWPSMPPTRYAKPTRIPLRKRPRTQ